MGKVAYCAVLVVLLFLSNPALASPGTGGSCSACHYHMNLFPGATTLKNADTTAAPNPAEGELKVIQMRPGETRTLQFEVGGWSADPNGTGLPDLYATAFRGYTSRGLNGGVLKFIGDPNWVRKSDYYYSPMGNYSGTKQSHSFSITVDSTTRQDYYLLDFMTGIYLHPTFGQVGLHGQEKFYLQVVPEPMTLTLLGLGAGVLVLRRRRRNMN